MTTKLTNIITEEVSLVGKGTNRKKFLLFKSDKEGNEMEELLKELLEETKELEGEKDILAKLKKHKMSDVEIATTQVALRLLSGVGDNVKKAGIVLKAFETKAEPPKVDAQAVAEFLKQAKDEDRAAIAKALGVDPKTYFGKEPEKKSDGILKADGTLNADAVPEGLRPALELLFKDGADTKAALKEANEKIQKADTEKKRQVWVEKAAEFKDLPGTDVGELASTLMKLDDADAEKIMKQMRASKEAIEKGALFSELGRGGGGPLAGSAIEKVNTLAKSIIAKNDKIDEPAAIAQVLKDNPALYTEYVKETQIRA